MLTPPTTTLDSVDLGKPVVKSRSDYHTTDFYMENSNFTKVTQYNGMTFDIGFLFSANTQTIRGSYYQSRYKGKPVGEVEYAYKVTHTDSKDPVWVKMTGKQYCTFTKSNPKDGVRVSKMEVHLLGLGSPFNQASPKTSGAKQEASAPKGKRRY
jgi:hypothetical protein